MPAHAHPGRLDVYQLPDRAKDTAKPQKDELPTLVREYLAPFGGVVAELRDGITDPDQINCAPVETIMAPALYTSHYCGFRPSRGRIGPGTGRSFW